MVWSQRRHAVHPVGLVVASLFVADPSRALAQAHNPAELRVYISRDGGDVYEDAFRRVAVTDGVFHPTLVLIPHRLGISGVTDVYREALKACIQMRQSVGIAG